MRWWPSWSRRRRAAAAMTTAAWVAWAAWAAWTCKTRKGFAAGGKGPKGPFSFIIRPLPQQFPQGQVAQLVEQRTENPCVAGSIPALATTTNRREMSDTISDEYLRMQQELHKNPNYGVASLHFAPFVADVIRQTGVRSVSDYGAGKKNLLKGLAQAGVSVAQYLPYDPAFPEYGPPRPADLVCCIDVLEHIEPERLDSVLRELHSITVGL